MMHLSYSMISADMAGENRHPQEVMKALGITYLQATPQSIYDSWWFWCCENVPKTLPPHMSELNLDPMKCIGNGLSPEDAARIADKARERAQ